MAKEYAKKFYNGKQWKKCRAGYISKRITIDGGLCERCRKNLGYIVDHKKEITPGNINDVSITLNQNNLSYLCHDCHNKKHFEKYSPTAEGIIFNENGEPVQSPL